MRPPARRLCRYVHDACRRRRRRVLGVVFGEELPLAVSRREAEEHDHRPDQHGDDACQVRPLVAGEERLLAPAVIAVAYWGYCAAIDSALANDSWSCDWTLAVIWSLLGSAAMLGGDRGRVAGGQERAEDRLHQGAAQIALEIRGARRHAGSPDRDRARERVGGGRPGETDADPDERVREPDERVRAALLPQEQHRAEPEQNEDVAKEQREPAPRASTSLAERGATRIIASAAGMIDRARVERRVAQHVLEELLADEHRAHQRAEHDDARDGSDPEDPPARDLEVVERVRGAALPDDERDARGDDDDREADDERAHVGDRREVDARISAPTRSD